MACGYQGTSSNTYRWDYRQHGKALVPVGNGRSEARNVVKEKFASQILRDAAAEFQCDEEACPVQHIVIKKFVTDIDIGSDSTYIYGRQYRWSGSCEWEADVYCLSDTEKLAGPAGDSGGTAGEGCGLVHSDDGPAVGLGQSPIDGESAETSAKENARANALRCLQRALTGNCPEACPERHVLYVMADEATTPGATHDEERDVWNARAEIALKLRVWCLPEGSRLGVSENDDGGGSDSRSRGNGTESGTSDRRSIEEQGQTHPGLLRRGDYPARGSLRPRFQNVALTPFKGVLLHIRQGEHWVVDEHDIALIVLDFFDWLIRGRGCVKMTNVEVTYPNLGITYPLGDINTCPEDGDCREVASISGNGRLRFQDGDQPVEVTFDEGTICDCR